MKVILKTLLIILCFVCVSDIDAQIGLRRKLFHEFRMGLNSSEMDIKGANRDKKVKKGFHFGYVGTYKFMEPFQVQTGIFLTKKGMKQSIDRRTESAIGTDITYERTRYEIDANYVQIPLMIGWETDYDKEWVFNINAGVYGAWGFKGRTKKNMRIEEIIGEGYEPAITYENSNIRTFTKSVLKKFDYGVLINAGVIYDVYLLNVSYEYGLYNVSQVDPELRNRNLTLSIGLRF
ncbi:porin family protein [Dysgonomonas massiliensis]|uniref:porin family protein n=1 Tax=Dysgonomonas massiliensis TaxID=2040292 RepID=UPI000C7925EF|nr:porin family protein [Dysgonomonas massiliensis]